MNMLASGFANFINGIFANWQMLLFVLCAVLFLMTILFRKFKITFIILLVAALAVSGVLIVDLIVEATSWDTLALINFLVKWVPTVLFAATVVFATLFGALWGLRKSLIFLLHAVITGALCIILYAVLINVKEVDGFLLNVVDFFMGGKGSLRRSLGVTAECAGLKDVFVEWLPTVIPDNSVGIMLGDSKAYIYTLADLICHVAFALVLYVLYLILNIILYIIYHCCYSERKYKQKVTQKYIDNKVDRRYHHYTLGGSVVGLVRGITSGLIALSFLGSALFIVAGRGDCTLKDFDFGSKQTNEYYSYYRAVESYGTHGIFKVLNAVSSPDEVPYYFFVADLVLSGELNDEEFGIKDHIVFREELDAYTGFARNTLALLMEYGGDKIAPIINGQNTATAFDTVLEVMSDDGFRAKFNDLITEFDTKTYVINLAMSFVNSAIANVDDMSFAGGISQDNRELLKLLFTKGHYSDVIPDEKELKQTLSDDSEFNLPYINVSKLVSKQDVQIIFNTVLDLLGEKTATVNDTLHLVGKILPQLQKISVLNENRAEELDPVLGRLYTYAVNRYLTAEGSEGVTYASIFKEDIEWVGEINSLITVSESALKLYDNVYAPSAQPFDMVISIFDKENENYKENTESFDDICGALAKSKLLGNALSTSYVYNVIKNSLNGLFNGIYIPKDIVYANEYNAEGKLISTGEMYNVFNGVRIIGENSDLLNQLKAFSEGSLDVKTFLPALRDAVATKDENKVTLATYVAKSQLLRSVVSAALITNCADYVYVPLVARESDAEGNKVNMVTQKELIVLFDFFDELVEFVTPVITGEGDASEALTEFVNSSVFDGIINDSTVFEGTVGKLLADNLADNDLVVIPRALKEDYEGWVTVNGKKGELKRLLDSFEALGMDVASAMEIDGNSVLDKLLDLTEEHLDTTLQSQVLHYTVSKFMIENSLDFGSFTLVVPTSAQQLIDGDVLESLVKKSELKNVLKIVNDFDINGDTQLSDVLVKVVKNKQVIKESNLLSSSIVYALASDGETADMLNLSDKFASAATYEKVRKYNSSNPWMKELPRLIDALDEILGISQKESITFDDRTLTDSMSELLKTMTAKSSVDEEETRLRICYASEVVANNITVRLDEILTGNVDEKLLIQSKSEGLYSYNELETLSDALKLFDIDIMNMEGTALTDKVRSELLTLNDVAEDPYFGYRTKLAVIYPSIIISGMMSKELDEALLEAKDDAGEPNPLIDEKILNRIKEYKTLYSQKEFEYMIDSVALLGIDNFDDLDTLNFNTVKDKKDNVDKICRSTVMRGVFTKQITKNAELGSEHPLAYEQDIKILKTVEIRSLVNLLADVDDGNAEGGNTNIEDMYFDNVKLSDIRNNAYDRQGGVTSYLILSAVSDVLRDTRELSIDSALIDEYDCINDREILAAINAFTALEGEDISIGKWNDSDQLGTGDGKFDYPTKAQRDIALESVIVRTKLTDQLVEINKGVSGNYVGKANMNKFLIDRRRDDYDYTASKGELTALFDAMDEIRALEGQTGSEFRIPTLSIDTLISYREMGNAGGKDYLRMMYASDVLRYKMCELVLTELEKYGAGVSGVTLEEAYDLNGFELVNDRQSIEFNELKSAIGRIEAAQSHAVDDN